MSFDYILRDGTIIDGTGRPAFKGDIGISGNKITDIGQISHQETGEEIFLGGAIITPGFIDMHNHFDLQVFKDPLLTHHLRQGVTSVIVGNCGFSPVLSSSEYKDEFDRYCSPILGEWHDDYFQSYEEFFKAVEELPPGINWGSCMGDGAARIGIQGSELNTYSSLDFAKTHELYVEARKAGALGISLGLMYSPEIAFSLEELKELGRIVKREGGVLSVHLRGEGDLLIPSIQEMLAVAEATDISLHISHLKAAGKKSWNSSLDKAIELINEGRAKGLDIACDVYPYDAGSTTLFTLFPPWVLNGGINETLKFMRDPDSRERLIHDMRTESDEWDNLVVSTGWDRVLISGGVTGDFEKFKGKSMTEIAALLGVSPEDAAIEITLKEKVGVPMVFFHMDEKDVIKVMSQEFSSIISDSLGVVTGLPHPRIYGSFPKFIREYILEKKICSMEEGILKMTSNPAKRMGLKGRGEIKIGNYADITAFNPDEIKDNASYTDPCQYATGLELVMVNGAVAVRNDTVTEIRNGKVLRG